MKSKFHIPVLILGIIVAVLCVWKTGFSQIELSYDAFFSRNVVENEIREAKRFSPFNNNYIFKINPQPHQERVEMN